MILSCGEALIDMLPRTTERGETAFAPYPGGAVLNTAVALGRLGAPSAFFSGISTDLFGAMLEDHLAASGVDTAPAARSGRPTTLAFVTLTDGHAKYAFYDENTAGRMLTQRDLPDVTPQAAFFGGISLVVDPCAETYAALAERLAPTTPIMLDPNIRPGFITDEAAYRARLDRLFGLADVVKSSDEDLAWLTGGTDPAPFFEKGVRVVLLTKGAEGIDILTARERLSVPARKAEVVDTVGAGDTFNAGFLAGLHRDGLLSKSALAETAAESLRAAAELGAQAAAVTVSRAGANPPWAHEL